MFALALLALLSAATQISTVFVDSRAEVSGSGSDSSPFNSLSPAVALIPQTPALTIQVIPAPGGTELSGTVTVQSQVEVRGDRAVVVVTGTLSVTQAGRLGIRGLVLVGKGSGGSAVVECVKCEFSLDNVLVENCERTFLEISGGTFTMQNSTFDGLVASGVIVRSGVSTILIADTDIASSPSLAVIDLRELPGSGSITLERVATVASGALLTCRNVDFGSFDIRVQHLSVLSPTQELVSGNVDNLNITIVNSEFEDIIKLLSGRVRSTNMTFTRSSVRGMTESMLDLSSLNGSIAITDSWFQRARKTPLISLPRSSTAPEAAKVSITASKFANFSDSASSGLLYCCESVTLLLRDIEVSDSYQFNSGLFSLSGGVAALEDVDYHDSRGRRATFFRAIASEVVVDFAELSNITHDSWCMACCELLAHCSLSNVQIKDLRDITPPEWFLYISVKFGAIGVVENSYFHFQEGNAVLLAEASNSGKLIIRNTVFDRVCSMETFGAYADGYIEVHNVTFIEPELDVLFSCFFTPNCLLVSNFTLVSEHYITQMIRSNGGTAVIINSEFRSIDGSAIQATNAQISLRNVTIRHMTGVLCSICASCQLLLDHFVLESSQATSMLEMTYSKVVGTAVRFRNVTCQQLVVLDTSEFVVTGGVFEQLAVNSLGGFIDATSSTIVLESIVFQRVFSPLYFNIGLLYLSTSTLSISSSTFSDFNSTLITSLYSPSVSITNSHFHSGGINDNTLYKTTAVRGSVLRTEGTLIVQIASSEFTHMSADYGGALYLSGSGKETCDIVDSAAASNHAENDGGFLYAKNVKVTVKNCQFMHNSARRGGALALISSPLNAIDRSQFSYNSGRLSGGAVQYVKGSNAITNCGWGNNSAPYGSDIASEVSYLSVYNATSQLIEPNYSFETVSGQTRSHEIVIACFDDMGQIVSIDNGSKLTLSAAQVNTSVFVSTLLESDGGFFHIANLMIVGSPGTTVTVAGAYQGREAEVLFSAHLRKCVPGEHFTDSQCKECSHNTYSFDPSQPCTLCPDHATCPSAYRVNPDTGYWRASNDTANLHQCLLTETCLGGFQSECKEGHEGVMCSHCSGGYYKFNQLQCIPCGHEGIAWARGVLSFSVAAAIVASSWLRSTNRLIFTVVVFDYFHTLRVLSNFNSYWPRATAYLLSVLGDLGSFGLTAFSNACFQYFSQTYTQLLVSSVSAFLIVLLSTSLAVVARSHFDQYHARKTPELTLCVVYLLLPGLYQRALQLFPCVQVSDAQYLIYDTAIDCSSSIHRKYSFALSVPILIVTMSVPVGLLTLSHCAFHLFPKHEAYYFSILLLRKYTLAVLLQFSGALQLCTQVGIAILVNIAVELLLMRKHFKQMKYHACYQWMLISSNLLSFAVVVFSASKSDYGYLVFTAGVYIICLLPAAQYHIQRASLWERIIPIHEHPSQMHLQYSMGEDLQSASQVEVQIQESIAPRSTPTMA